MMSPGAGCPLINLRSLEAYLWHNFFVKPWSLQFNQGILNGLEIPVFLHQFSHLFDNERPSIIEHDLSLLWVNGVLRIVESETETSLSSSGQHDLEKDSLSRGSTVMLSEGHVECSISVFENTCVPAKMMAMKDHDTGKFLIFIFLNNYNLIFEIY